MVPKKFSTKWGNQILKTSEGVVRVRRVEYTVVSGQKTSPLLAFCDELFK
jgi:hypothetical protein